jgi:hypothetical protein
MPIIVRHHGLDDWRNDSHLSVLACKGLDRRQRFPQRDDLKLDAFTDVAFQDGCPDKTWDG